MLQSHNPLFPQNQPSPDDDKAPFMAPRKEKRIEPLGEQAKGANSATDLIREKLARIYADAPDTTEQVAAPATAQPLSKHQQFMQRLSTSGKSLADIQVEWHEYYASLPDEEKHQVWQEFYETNARAQAASPITQPKAEATLDTSALVPLPTSPQPITREKSGIVVADHIPMPERTVKKPARRKKVIDKRSPSEIKEAIRDRVTAGGKLEGKHNLQSLLFGIGTGLIAVFIFLFGFFNEVLIAPFIQPSRTAAATPIIVDPNSVQVGDTPQVIIPKINVQIPVDYNQTSTSEATIQDALESGVVHYPTTKRPGEIGNAAFFGHSSNNIFNKGKYKFAFVLLSELVEGDTFYLTYNGKAYVYRVTSKRIVQPSEVSVLNDIPSKSTATLITCDPPGTSLHRLVVVGEQISPDPSSNNAEGAAPKPTVTTSHQLPGNGPTLWTRMWRSVF
jgi:sortase A